MTEEHELFGTIFAAGDRGAVLGPPDYWLRYSEDDVRRNLMFRLCNLASSTISTFMGLHPARWPFFPDSFETLPWLDEYWLTEGDHLRPLPEAHEMVRSEFGRIASELISALEQDGQGDSLLEPFGAVWLSRDLMSTPKGAVQGLATQALFCANVAIADLLADDLGSAGDNLGRTYDNVLLVHVECEPLFGGAKGLGRQGGLARSKKDPRSKDKEFVRNCWERWERDPKRYTSIEEFARDMLEKTEHLAGSTQVIARWVRAWRKQRTEAARYAPNRPGRSPER